MNIFFVSRMIAILVMLMLATSFLLAAAVLQPYLPKLVNSRSPSEQDRGVEASEGIAPAWHWQFAVPVTADVDEKIDDPWGSHVGWFYGMSLPSCMLPNRQTSSISSNSTHYNYVCSFIPHAQTASAVVITAPDSTNPVVEISWQGLDTSRIYRYHLVWQRGIVTTFAENALSRIRVEQHILPSFLNTTNLPDRSHSCSYSDQIIVRGPGGTQIATTSYSTTISTHRINGTHHFKRLVVSFSQSAQIQQIEWIRNRGNCQWATDFIIMRITFVDAANNVRTINVAPGDTFVFDRVLILRQR